MSVFIIYFKRFFLANEILLVVSMIIVGVTTYLAYLSIAVRLFNVKGIENLLSMLWLSLRKTLGI